MNLVFIYGPPAAGKLTVARELEKLTGYKLFHNHLVVDLLTSAFEFGTKEFLDLSGKIRLDFFEEASRQGISLIFTFCYVPEVDNEFVKDAIEKIEEHKGRVCFVQLLCDKPELLKRVEHTSRGKFNKIKTADKLKKVLEAKDFFSKVLFAESLTIDTTKTAPKKSAELIKAHFNL